MKRGTLILPESTIRSFVKFYLLRLTLKAGLFNKFHASNHLVRVPTDFSKQINQLN